MARTGDFARRAGKGDLHALSPSPGRSKITVSR
jgi:hypothetical protein